MHPIARRRRRMGWSQTELARRLSVSPTTVNSWEHGTLPRPGLLRRLAYALEVDPGTLDDELIAWIEEEKKQGELSAAR